MKKQKINNIIFVSILLIISYVFIFYMFGNNHDINFIDNRSAYKFTAPKVNQVMNGQYQSIIEETIADQIPEYNYFKILPLKISNYTNIKSVETFNLDRLNKYVRLGDVCLYNDYLVYQPSDSIQNSPIARKNVNEINKIISMTNANVYLYYANTDVNYNFETGFKIDEVSYLRSALNLEEQNIASLDIDSFDDYKKYYYSNDHHWNNKGSYKGYTDIANLMHLDVVPEIQEEICFNAAFNGSKLRSVANVQVARNRVCVYTFNLPEYDIYISKQLVDDYGTPVKTLESQSDLTYGYIYGNDYDEIAFVNKEIDSNRKLLIYANSFSNAINKLLAANYKETYVIDGRHFNDQISMIDYINENGIDDVLILGNHILFSSDLRW